MTGNLKAAFNGIQAEDRLKAETLSFLHDRIQENEKQGKRNVFIKAVIAFASIAVVLFAGIFSYNVYYTPSAYVDMDVNPSIGLTLNRFSRVIEALAYNDDGAKVLSGVEIRHKAYNEATQILLNTIITQGYLAEDGLISITVQTNDSNIENSMLDTIQKAVSLSLSEYNVTAQTDIFSVAEDDIVNAHGNHVTAAKYLAITELQEVDPTVTFEDCVDHGINEIRERARNRGNWHNEDDVSNPENAIMDPENTVPNSADDNFGHEKDYGESEDGNHTPVSSQEHANEHDADNQPSAGGGAEHGQQGQQEQGNHGNNEPQEQGNHGNNEPQEQGNHGNNEPPSYSGEQNGNHHGWDDESGHH